MIIHMRRPVKLDINTQCCMSGYLGFKIPQAIFNGAVPTMNLINLMVLRRLGQ